MTDQLTIYIFIENSDILLVTADEQQAREFAINGLNLTVDSKLNGLYFENIQQARDWAKTKTTTELLDASQHYCHVETLLLPKGFSAAAVIQSMSRELQDKTNVLKSVYHGLENTHEPYGRAFTIKKLIESVINMDEENE